MKFSSIVLCVNVHRLMELDFDMTSHFQDGGHDVISCNSAATLLEPMNVGLWFYVFMILQSMLLNVDIQKGKLSAKRPGKQRSKTALRGMHSVVDGSNLPSV